MAVNTAIETSKDFISREKMQVHVINRRPAHASVRKETVKIELEQQLFAVFCKYESPHQESLHTEVSHV